MARMFYRAVARKFGVDVNTPVCDMPKGMLDMILYGTNKEKIEIDYIQKKHVKKERWKEYVRI